MAELNRCAKCGSKAELIFFESYGERNWPMAVVKCTSCDNEDAMARAATGSGRAAGWRPGRGGSGCCRGLGRENPGPSGA